MDMIRPTLSGGAETGTVDLLTYMLTMDKFKVLMVILVSAICANRTWALSTSLTEWMRSRSSQTV